VIGRGGARELRHDPTLAGGFITFFVGFVLLRQAHNAQFADPSVVQSHYKTS